MLLVKKQVQDDVLVGFGRIDTNSSYSHRENERHAVRMLIAEMLGEEDVELKHNEAGKPLLDGWHISVSHTRGYAAVILSVNHEVGIDIEYVSTRVDRIAKRFMRSDEIAEDTTQRLINWCAKETVYKLFSEDDLTYQQMRVTIVSTQSAIAENLKRNISVDVAVETTSDYVLAFAVF